MAKFVVDTSGYFNELAGTYNTANGRIFVPVDTGLQDSQYDDPYTGQVVFIEDSGLLCIYDSANWRKFQTFTAFSGIRPDDAAISGQLKFWFSSFNSDHYIASGSGVSAISELSPATPTVSPTNVTIASGSNAGLSVSRGAFYFNGTSARVSTNISAFFDGEDANFTICAMVRPVDVNTGAGTIFMAGRSTSNLPLVNCTTHVDNGPRWFMNKRDDANTAIINAYADASSGQPIHNNWHIVTFRHSGGDGSLIGDIYVSGVHVMSSGFDNPDLGTLTLNTSNVGVTQRIATSNWFHGFIAEVIIYNSGLTNEQRLGVEQYLAGKWELELGV